MWNNNKRLNIFVFSVPKVKEKEYGKVFEEILAKNFPNLAKGINLYSQGAE